MVKCQKPREYILPELMEVPPMCGTCRAQWSRVSCIYIFLSCVTFLNILYSWRIHSECSRIHSEYSRRIHSEECSRIHSEYGILPDFMEVPSMCATCRAQQRWVSCSLGLSLPFPLFSSFSRSHPLTFPFSLSLFLPLPPGHAALSGPRCIAYTSFILASHF